MSEDYEFDDYFDAEAYHHQSRKAGTAHIDESRKALRDVTSLSDRYFAKMVEEEEGYTFYFKAYTDLSALVSEFSENLRISNGRVLRQKLYSFRKEKNQEFKGWGDKEGRWADFGLEDWEELSQEFDTNVEEHREHLAELEQEEFRTVDYFTTLKFGEFIGAGIGLLHDYCEEALRIDGDNAEQVSDICYKIDMKLGTMESVLRWLGKYGRPSRD